ncbi:hypothetical protein BJ742DRAFT_782517 [Cladochytrium replicatum]|nr:hypothetical protein BJ742DRAFT_782517 [Cladochytrium replicatum]
MAWAVRRNHLMDTTQFSQQFPTATDLALVAAAHAASSHQNQPLDPSVLASLVGSVAATPSTVNPSLLLESLYSPHDPYASSQLLSQALSQAQNQSYLSMPQISPPQMTSKSTSEGAARDLAGFQQSPSLSVSAVSSRTYFSNSELESAKMRQMGSSDTPLVAATVVLKSDVPNQPVPHMQQTAPSKPTPLSVSTKATSSQGRYHPHRLTIVPTASHHSHNNEDEGSEPSSPNGTGSEDSLQTAKANLSRHVTSVISHFTANKEGYRRLIHELDDFLHVVSPSGIIQYTAPSVLKYLGYPPEELTGKHVGDLLHKDDQKFLTSKISECNQTRKLFTVYCRYQKKGGEFVLLEVRGKPYVDEETQEVRYIMNSAREYRSRASGLIDSILELRIENFRLRQQFESILRERGIEPSTHPLLKALSENSGGGFTEDGVNGGLDDFGDADGFGEEMGRGAKAGIGAGSSTTISFPPRHASLDTISPRAVNVLNRKDELDGRIGETMGTEVEAKTLKRKKLRVAQEELFCRQCGTTSSPEWRKGPTGPKTLCNACGLAFSKKLKKKSTIIESAPKVKKSDGGGDGSPPA